MNGRPARGSWPTRSAALFAAFGGLALTSTTGIGSPLSGEFYTLTSVAAVVIGGVSLAGGKGGLFGPIIAAFILSAAVTVLVFAGVDANYGQVIQGALIVLVVMFGGLLAEAARMSVAPAPTEETPPTTSDRVQGVHRDQPLVMLGVILVLLVVACTIIKPGYFSSDQVGRGPALRGAAGDHGRAARRWRMLTARHRPLDGRHRDRGGLRDGLQRPRRHGQGDRCSASASGCWSAWSTASASGSSGCSR